MDGNGGVSMLRERLRDQRSGEVVFLSHCLLNEHTRYLGGAARPACVQEIVSQCVDASLGMVQMPCPEQQAWGGILKRRLLALYGWRRRHPVAGWVLGPLLPRIASLYSRLVYRRIAREVARDVGEYLEAGYGVRAIVAVDGSPSCGLRTRIDFTALDAFAMVDPAQATVEEQNEIVRRYARPGTGIFTSELQRALRRHGNRVPFVAHDLLAEIDGRPTTLQLGP